MQIIWEKEALEMLHWCFPAEGASVLCLEVFGSQQEIVAGRSLEQKLELGSRTVESDLWGSSCPQSLVGTTYPFLLLLMEKAEKCKQSQKQKVLQSAKNKG